jgi:flagellar biosynthesis/type III secretory pathway chaperone
MDAHRLAKLIDRKHVVLSQLRELVRRQDALIAEGDLDSLMRVLGAKQQLLAALQEVEAELRPFRDQDPEAREWASDEQRQASRDANDQCAEMLSEIVALEKQCEARLAQRREATAARLEVVVGAAKARGAYASVDGGQTGSLNLVSES